MSFPLANLLILDLTRVLAGPFCTMMLAELGARVIKVETPETGDDARHYGPFQEGKSAYYMSLNRGKESIALDLKTEGDRRIFEALLAKADVIVENYRPGTMEKLGYGWETLHAKHPQLIYAASSGFGHSGPYRQKAAYDLVVQAMGGLMSLTGHPGSEPVRVGTSVGDITAGLFTTIGITSALYQRQQTGQGVKIDVSMLDCQIAILENAIARYFTTGEIPGPSGSRHPAITPFEGYRTQDGYIILAAGNNILFQKLAEALGVPALATDPRFVTNPLRNQYAEELKGELERALAAQGTAAWLELFEQAGVPAAPIQNIAEAVHHPQIEARQMIVTVDDPVAGVCHMAGNPIKFSHITESGHRASAPELDADREKILRELGM